MHRSNLRFRFAALLVLGMTHQRCFALAPIEGMIEGFLYSLGFVGLIFMAVGGAVSKNRLQGALTGGAMFIAFIGAILWAIFASM